MTIFSYNSNYNCNATGFTVKTAIKEMIKLAFISRTGIDNREIAKLLSPFQQSGV